MNESHVHELKVENRRDTLDRHPEPQCALELQPHNQSVQLRCGLILPCIGFGTFRLRDQECVAAVTSALEHGYQLVDTASMYGNQQAIAQAIRGVPRSRIFLTSKVRNINIIIRDNNCYQC